MSDPAKREIKYECVVCEKPSYQPKTEVDFGPSFGKRKISICGQCLRWAERGMINLYATLDIDPLLPFIPSFIVEKVMNRVLDDFRLPVQGS